MKQIKFYSRVHKKVITADVEFENTVGGLIVVYQGTRYSIQKSQVIG